MFKMNFIKSFGKEYYSKNEKLWIGETEIRA